MMSPVMMSPVMMSPVMRSLGGSFAMAAHNTATTAVTEQ